MEQSSAILTGDIIKREKQWRKVRKHVQKYERNIGKKEFTPYMSETMHPMAKVNQTIWVCWFQGVEHAPAIVKKCIKAIERNKPENFEVVYLTTENIKGYVDFPEYIYKKMQDGKINFTHFSDLLRAELLYLYGGLWIDATVYCADKIPEYMCSGELFAFRWSLLDGSVVSISSWWMYAPKGQKIISDTRNMLLEYWKYENRLCDYYLFHILFSMAKDRNIVNRNAFSRMVYANNSEPQILFGKLEQQFNRKEWEVIRKKMPIQKLSYKKRMIQGDLDNYYTALMEGRLMG